MAVVVEQYLEQFDRNFNEIKDLIYEQFPKQYPIFMQVEEDSRAFIKKSYMGGLGMPTENRDLEGIPYSQPPKGPVATYVPVNYRNGYQIERQMIEQEEWGLLASRPQTMMYGAAVLMDIVGANILNNGFTSQPYDFDPSGTAKPLFSTDNTREDMLATWSNRVDQNLPITVETVFETLASYLYNMEDTNGLPIMYGGNFNLYVPSINPTLWQQATEVAKSINNPGTSDNKINALTHNFTITPVYLRYLTNPNAWFIGWESSAPNYGLRMVVNKYPEVSGLAPMGNNPDAWYSRLRMRFTAGYENKRGIVGVGA